MATYTIMYQAGVGTSQGTRTGALDVVQLGLNVFVPSFGEVTWSDSSPSPPMSSGANRRPMCPVQISKQKRNYRGPNSVQRIIQGYKLCTVEPRVAGTAAFRNMGGLDHRKRQVCHMHRRLCWLGKIL